MNGTDLLNNLIDELARASVLIAEMQATIDYHVGEYEGCYNTESNELLNDIKSDLDRYYDVRDSIVACIEDIVVE